MEMSRQKFLIGASAALLIPGAQEADARSKIITKLPASKTKRFAWTIDDGVSSPAVASYLDIAEEGVHHLTLFITSGYDSWRTNSKQIARLLEAGSIQLGNHTVRHKDLTTLSSQQVKKELLDCHNFMMNQFGYDARPYFRPPYGISNSKVRSVAADIGYTVPTMWYGSFGDNFGVSDERIVQFAKKWIADGRIVIDHCNKLKSKKALTQIQQIMKSRGLQSVTLREAFGPNFK
jgi:peptidoglycan/xylan/chitin deacetylase (PgdA/CDA1 family)